MRDAHLPGDLGPEADDAVDAPVADPDKPEAAANPTRPRTIITTSAAPIGRSVSGACANATVGGQMKFGATVGSQSGDGYGSSPRA